MRRQQHTPLFSNDMGMGIGFACVNRIHVIAWLMVCKMQVAKVREIEKFKMENRFDRLVKDTGNE